ncbi:GNAT family N-acetyltransferase [Paenibacillus aceti]|uniref:N-acetyltransferase domain-containing protein n=1 Tax=Paenibacillus aceti TaxID=1820010 RepID=A0ABQ1W3I0_9BACL|nr:GNAT family N-acetyltransferase [Paenibacillus aceti]GGG12892.1 hypothetical protein GCM10010913_38330 [Paenibacillus aceti]
MNIELRALSEDDGIEIFEMIQEMGLGENGFTNTFPVSSFEEFKLSLPRQIQISQGFDLSEGYVPQTIYWMYVDGHPVAYGKLRHRLNDKLMRYGGHIGYMVRPSERGKGYGKIY